ncbi:MAG: undecaprenyl/decaprenyl-phosphate alpha-N-acetylglucosaminyl 1-phosphate transferase [Chloroflexi bacterium]|nr:undecaprenyl/decaprenyl-phosphate alpha-N-acetylglucosaminyl 1-phosphate transferase [Chloroflexota bacterium]
MSNFLLIFAAALVCAIGATPIARQVALRLGIINEPAGNRFSNKRIPMLGGIAMYAAFIIAVLLFAEQFYISQMLGILVGATWVSFLGIWDDRKMLNPLAKFAGQIFGALILILTGVQVEFLHQPVLNAGATIVWVLGITNAINFLDNMDGLSGGVAAIAAFFFLALAALNGQILVGMLAAAMLGAALGFLLYNFNPATIFMGDAGSLFIGFILAAIGIKLRFPANTDLVTWMVPVLVLGLPIFDTTLVTLSRLRRRVPIYVGGKDHTSHRLVQFGLSPRASVLVLYLVSAACGALALIVAQADLVTGYALASVGALIALIALWQLESRFQYPG